MSKAIGFAVFNTGDSDGKVAVRCLFAWLSDILRTNSVETLEEGFVVKGFFFDLDGTLVDTHQANFEAYRLALQEAGFTLTFEDFKRSIGHHAGTFLPWFAPGLNKAGYDAIRQSKAEHYDGLVHLSKLNSELVTFMELMQGNQLVLVTTASRRNAQGVLSHHGLEKHFQYIITGNDVENLKPEPDAYLLALQKTGLKPTEALAFEDSETGRRAAEAAGIQVAMINKFLL